MIREVITASEAETTTCGAELGGQLGPDTVVLLKGLLGAGKTAFVRGLAQGVGCDPAVVSSPTFTIVQEYRGPITIQHIDLYRLTPVEVEDLGLEDLMPGALLAVEWPERWADPPQDAVRVDIELTGDNTRRIRIHSTR